MFGKYGWIVGLALMLGGAGALLWWGLGLDAPDPAGGAVVVRRGVRPSDAKPSRADKHRARREASEASKTSRTKPDLSLDSEDESQLKGEMKKLFNALQAELDADNKKKAFKLIEKMQSLDEWPDDIPLSVKLKALEALKWFGASGSAAAALLRFLGDGNSRVVEEANGVLADMISDTTIGDRAMSALVKSVIGSVKDAEALESIVLSLGDMRNSVRIDTASAIYASGNATAVNVLNENVDFLFCDGEVEVKGPGDLEAYAKANPDDPDDETMYGPAE